MNPGTTANRQHHGDCGGKRNTPQPPARVTNPQTANHHRRDGTQFNDTLIHFIDCQPQQPTPWADNFKLFFLLVF
jgi:hypothetical protein